MFAVVIVARQEGDWSEEDHRAGSAEDLDEDGDSSVQEHGKC